APFRSGIGLLAKQLGIPVVPVYLDGLFDLKQAERIITRPGHVRVTIGSPIRFSREEDSDTITRELARRVRELQPVREYDVLFEANRRRFVRNSTTRVPSTPSAAHF